MRKEDLLNALKNENAQNRIEGFGGISKQSVSMPSMYKMVNNLKNSIINNVSSVYNGNALNVSEEEAKKRLSICKSCEFFDQSRQRCSQCGCKLAIKTYLKAEKCPINKW